MLRPYLHLLSLQMSYLGHHDLCYGEFCDYIALVGSEGTLSTVTFPACFLCRTYLLCVYVNQMCFEKVNFAFLDIIWQRHSTASGPHQIYWDRAESGRNGGYLIVWTCNCNIWCSIHLEWFHFNILRNIGVINLGLSQLA